jgi:hypothetical protein
MVKGKKRRGDTFYKKAGFTKPILLHVSQMLHAKLTKMAEMEERSLQVTLRRILEKHAGLREEA